MRIFRESWSSFRTAVKSSAKQKAGAARVRRPLRLFGLLLLGCLSRLSGCCAGFPLLFFLTVKLIKPGASFIPDCCNQLSGFGLLKGGVKKIVTEHNERVLSLHTAAMSYQNTAL